MKFRLGCELAYKVVAETVFIFNVEVALLQRHSDLVDHLIFNPNVERCSYTVPDLKNRYTQVVAPVGNFSLSYTAEVDLNIYRADPETVHEMQVRDLPLDILPYLLPSRFVPSDELATYAMREFAGFPNGHIRVSIICSWIYQNIEYRPGSSDSETTATETLIQRAGVCRDFAHLGIAFCRALGIPARFVTCYARPFAIRFPRRVRGLSGRSLVTVRRHTTGGARWVGANWDRARRRRGRVRDGLWPDDARSNQDLDR